MPKVTPPRVWVLTCPSGHDAQSPHVEVLSTPEGLLVALTCRKCNGGKVWCCEAGSYVIWEESPPVTIRMDI